MLLPFQKLTSTVDLLIVVWRNAYDIWHKITRPYWRDAPPSKKSILISSISIYSTIGHVASREVSTHGNWIHEIYYEFWTEILIARVSWPKSRLVGVWSIRSMIMRQGGGGVNYQRTFSAKCNYTIASQPTTGRPIGGTRLQPVKDHYQSDRWQKVAV